MVDPDLPGAWSARTAVARRTVEARLRGTVAAAADELRTVDPDLGPLADELVRWIDGGGKRLRPVLVWIGHELAGGTGLDVVGAAVGVELVHTWALVHDDLIDASATRRGAPTTHERFASDHRRAGWEGDAAAWGAAQAILLGDLLAVLANDAFDECDVSPHRLAAGRVAFQSLQREVLAGQVLDVTVAAQGRASVERALRVATLKSGRYSVTRPLEVGATLAGADGDLQAALARVGDALGLAFQLADDLLGLFGDSAETGKPVGDDLREGKRTVLVAETMARLDDVDRSRLAAVLGRRDAPDQDVAAAIELVAASGGREATRHRLEDLLDQARRHLRHLPDVPARGSLSSLADLIADRRH